MNNVSLIGNLATEVDLKELDDEKKVANFLLAVPRTNRDEADFVSVTAWDRQAETSAQYLTKGRRVAIEGRLRSRSWEEDGKRRTVVEVVANRVEFLSSPPILAEADVIPFEAARAG